MSLALTLDDHSLLSEWAVFGQPVWFRTCPRIIKLLLRAHSGIKVWASSYASRGAQVRGGQNFLCEGGLQWQPRHLIGRHRATVVFQTTQAHCGVAPSQWYATEPGGAHSAQGHCGVAPSHDDVQAVGEWESNDDDNGNSSQHRQIDCRVSRRYRNGRARAEVV